MQLSFSPVLLVLSDSRVRGLVVDVFFLLLCFTTIIALWSASLCSQQAAGSVGGIKESAHFIIGALLLVINFSGPSFMLLNSTVRLYSTQTSSSSSSSSLLNPKFSTYLTTCSCLKLDEMSTLFMNFHEQSGHFSWPVCQLIKSVLNHPKILYDFKCTTYCTNKQLAF